MFSYIFIFILFYLAYGRKGDNRAFFGEGQMTNLCQDAIARFVLHDDPKTSKKWDSEALKNLIGALTDVNRLLFKNESNATMNAIRVINLNKLFEMTEVNSSLIDRFFLQQWRVRFLKHPKPIDPTNHIYRANPYYQSLEFYNKYRDALYYKLVDGFQTMRDQDYQFNDEDTPILLETFINDNWDELQEAELNSNRIPVMQVETAKDAKKKIVIKKMQDFIDSNMDKVWETTDCEYDLLTINEIINTAKTEKWFALKLTGEEQHLFKNVDKCFGYLLPFCGMEHYKKYKYIDNVQHYKIITHTKLISKASYADTHQIPQNILEPSMEQLLTPKYIHSKSKYGINMDSKQSPFNPLSYLQSYNNNTNSNHKNDNHYNSNNNNQQHQSKSFETLNNNQYNQMLNTSILNLQHQFDKDTNYSRNNNNSITFNKTKRTFRNPNNNNDNQILMRNPTNRNNNNKRIHNKKRKLTNSYIPNSKRFKQSK